jgi:tRNA(Ile)-lysidine synthase
MKQLEQNVKVYIQQMNLIAPGDHLLIACSGGVDSMALLHFLHKESANLHITISCAHVDHMLRGTVSKKDLEFVERYCLEQGIPFYGTSIPIASIVQQEGGNVQAICRRERYQFLEDTLLQIGASKLVTAHHADDQLESVLMALTTKRSTKGLEGIHAIRSFERFKVIRPFLMVTKQEIREYLRNNSLTWREDSSNEKDDYTRNKFRHHIAPLLTKENPQVAQNVVHLANQIREDNEFLMQLAQERFFKVVTEIGKNSYNLQIESLKQEPVSLQRRLVLILLNYIYGDSNTLQTYHLTSMILNLCKSEYGTAEVHLPNNYVAQRMYGTLVVQPNEERTAFEKRQVEMNKWVPAEQFQLYMSKIANAPLNVSSSQMIFYFSSSEVTLPLHIRTLEKGDRIQLFGMRDAKRVSRIFIDEKIPSTARGHWPLLIDANENILAVVGIRISDKLSRVRRPIDDYFFSIK